LLHYIISRESTRKVKIMFISYSNSACSVCGVCAWLAALLEDLSI
jgi:hypothetical protein